MPDVFTKAKRSQVMSRIRSRGNKDTELALMRVFRAQGITGWRRHWKLRVGEWRVESRKKNTSPRPSPQKNVPTQRPSPGLRPPSPVPTGEGKSGEGEARRRRKNSQRSTFNSQLTVRPDFVFPKLRLAVFVDGCFWHCCPLHATKPRHNAAFWRRKLAGNKARDRLVTRRLRSANWRVLRLWEHELARKRQTRLVSRLRRFLNSSAGVSRK